MGKFLAVVTSYLLICCGYQLFRDSSPLAGEDVLPSYIFLTSVFILLYDLRLYPKALRKLDKYSQIMIEFLVASFLMEHILFDFWLPLEVGNRAILMKMAEKIEESTTETTQQLEIVAEYIKSSMFIMIVSYVLSIFFLLSVLHAIRAVDFRALQEGPTCFFGDIAYRSQRFLRRKLKSCGIKRQKRVKIQELPEMNKREYSNDRKCPGNVLSDNKFEVEDYDGAESLDDPSLQFSDFDIPCDSDLLCD